MRRARLFLAFSLSWLLGLSLLSPAWALPQKKTVELQKRIDLVLKSSAVPAKNLGLWVQHKDQLIYQLNGEKKFIPASVTKIMTAAASLDLLPKGHTFKTELLSEASRQGVVLSGNLYLRGGGDPSLTSEKMWALVNQFTRLGIKKVEGDLVFDDTRFDQVRFDSTRLPDRSDRSYDAPVGALSFNWNTVNLFVRPADEVGEPAQIVADPISEYSEIINQVRTVRGSRGSISVDRLTGPQLTDENLVGDKILLRGSIGVNAKEWANFVGISQPDLWTAVNLRSFLKRRGIEVNGTVIKGRTPSDAKVLTSIDSQPLRDQITSLMKYSNNFVAEMLTKNLAAEENSSRPATLAGGVERLRQWLDRVGIDRQNYTLVNPSGLTRKNLLRPKDVNRVLMYLQKRFGLFAEYLAAQPLSGVDGTLHRRMKENESEAFARVRAKTGTLSGVNGLAGYVGRKDEEILTFVFLFNGAPSQLGAARKTFDQLSAELVK